MQILKLCKVIYYHFLINNSTFSQTKNSTVVKNLIKKLPKQFPTGQKFINSNQLSGEKFKFMYL